MAASSGVCHVSGAAAVAVVFCLLYQLDFRCIYINIRHYDVALGRRRKLII